MNIKDLLELIDKVYSHRVYPNPGTVFYCDGSGRIVKDTLSDLYDDDNCIYFFGSTTQLINHLQESI